MALSEGEFQADMAIDDDNFKKNTGLSLREQYLKFHPQVLSDFEDEMEKLWGKKWKANTNVGKLKMVLLHRPGPEFESIGKKTPFPPFLSHLPAWRMAEKIPLEELTEDHLNLVDAYKAEGVEVVIRKPESNSPPYQVKAIYTDDVCHPGVYGQIILRMYDWIRKGEERYTLQTLAEIGCPVVGMIIGNGMTEGGSIGWLDEKHLIIGVHFPRSNTQTPEVMRANEFGHNQFVNIIKTQDPEVDIRIQPGYGSRIGASHYCLVDRHTSVQDPKMLDPYLRSWMETEMNWEFIDPPEEVCVKVHTRDPRTPFVKRAPNTGVVLEPRKILVNEGNSKATKWFESIGIEVVEVDVATLVRPRNSGSIHCTAGSLIRDSEPKSY
jgi:N-dimethylarginine dimethylaminohydrolase